MAQGGSDVHAIDGALDDQSAALVPRPALDPDPCGRVVDPGLSDAITWELRLRRAVAAARQPTELFARSAGEDVIEHARRTNELRLGMLELLRDLVGDLDGLQLIDFLARRSGRSWASFAELPPPLPVAPGTAASEFWDDGSGRAGRLDSLFLALDELLSDLGGLGAEAPGCRTDAAIDRPLSGGNAGVFQRNPNGYFAGLFYSDLTAPLQGTGPVTTSRDAALRDEFVGTLSLHPFECGLDVPIGAECPSDDVSPERALPEQAGLLATALRGLHIDESGIHRPGDHLCLPIGDCFGVPPLTMPVGAAGTCDDLNRSDCRAAIPGAEDALPVLDGSGALVCPAIRPGAANRYPLSALGLPLARPVFAGSPVGCCAGFQPVSCGSDADCDRFDIPASSGVLAFDAMEGRCNANGVCEAARFSLECALAGTCPFEMRCLPDDCVQGMSAYCTDQMPMPPMSSGCPDDPADRCSVTIGTQLARWRDAACGPGARCETSPGGLVPHETARAQTPPLLRQLFGHYAMRLLSPTGITASISDAASEIGDVFGSLLGDDLEGASLSEHLDFMSLRWLGHADGSLGLQGYLEVVVRLRDPAIVVDGQAGLGPLDDIEISESKIRIVLQPYFFPSPPPGALCDSCRRRRPDMTLHWALVDVDLLSTEPGSSGPPEISGCDCGGFGPDIGACAVANCIDREFDDQELTELDRVPALLESRLERQVGENALQALSRLLYLLSSDSAVGGMILGRLRAIDDLADRPECPPVAEPASTTMPLPPRIAAVRNDACFRGGPFAEHRRVEIVDTIEALRIVDGRAEVRARENGDL